MATWRNFGWTGGAATDTAANAAAVVVLGDGENLDSALSFGGGTRASFQSNISINNWNTAMHWAVDTTEGSTDYCPSPHLWPLTPVALNFAAPDRDTACYLDGTYIPMADGTPGASRGIGMRFTHDFGVKCHPVTIWAGTAETAQTRPLGCYIAICDLTSSQPQWSTATYSNKLSLVSHGVESEEHWWNIAVSVAPLQVGHIGENCVKIETVYY